MTTTFSESDEKYYLRMINHKPIWKDRSIKGADTVSNTVCITPIHSLSSYHLWMRRNLILIKSTDEYVYISGSNLILGNFADSTQKIIPIKNDCHVTSIYHQKSSTNEKLIFISEKVNPTEDYKYFSGRVELINLDCKMLPERVFLDLGAYVNYDSYAFDCVAPEKGDLAFVVIKNVNESDPKSKIFVWNYVSRQIVDIEDFKYSFSGIARNPFNPNGIVVFGANYLALWEYSIAKKDLLCEYEFYNSSDKEVHFDISDAEFVRFREKKGLCVSFKNEYFELWEMISEDVVGDGGLMTQKRSYKLFLRIDLFSFMDENWVNIKDRFTEPDVEKFTENFDNFDPLAYTPNFGSEKPTISGKKNFIKYIISREQFIFLFLENSNITIILEFFETKDKETKIKVSSIDKIQHKVQSKCSIGINSKLTRMLIINGESIYKFYSLLAKRRDSSKGDKLPDNFFKLQEVTLSYVKYKINFVDGAPNFVFEEEILKNSGIGYPSKRVLISETPKIIMVNSGEDERDIYLYKQAQLGNEETFNKMKIGEVGTPTYINMHSQFYKENTRYQFFIHKKLEEKPLHIAFSPLGKCFFVSYKDSGYLYGILGQEIKEILKVSMYCRACSFSADGTYLAFSTSEFENDYQINVFNMCSYEYDYVIERVPPPTKLEFIDGGRILVAQFNDSGVNLIGWELRWDSRLVTSTSGGTKEKVEKEPDEANLVFKVSDFSGNIMDFVYDATLEHCLFTSADKRVRVYKGYKEDKHWEFGSDVQYPCCVLLKKYDTIVFGTSNGSIRSCLWPIANLLKDSNIDHPDYTETFLHVGKVTYISVSKDNTFLYSSGEDGSVFISLITAITNDSPVSLSTFVYFNPSNVLPKKMYYSYQDITYVTDSIYQSKLDALSKQKNVIQSLISEFITNKEKLVQNNMNALEKKRTELTKSLEERVKAVKEKENEKERETKRLKEEREQQVKKAKDKLNLMKKDFKVQKEAKQVETTKLINCIKVAKEKFNQKKTEIEAMRNKTNTNIVNSLETMYKILQEKKVEIDKLIEERKEKFKQKCDKNEELYETDIREKEKNFKISIEDFEEKKKETDNEIMKKNKDNKNYDEKITEWENHLKELKINNEELMETYIFNTLKLNQMNQLLSENETKISVKEKIVKEKRLVNDRLEQLRFVLEYQIKNLILEKTPIEEQIKNFESLHSDFYKRFNLLYAELLNISELIENNQECIKTYRDELSETKKKLYELKNLYKSIDVALNSILKNKLNSKKDIIDQIFSVYQTYLLNFSDVKKQQKVLSNEAKLQTKNIEKEIYHQKNNVLRELIEKRSERRRIGYEKEQMMKDIRLDNQLLIQECSNIRENLEDIQKNINDIEKKFLELKLSCENK